MSSAEAGAGATGTGAAPGADARRALWAWVLACAAGAGLVLLAAGRGWVVLGDGGPGAGASEPSVLTGSTAVPSLSPVALAVLAAVVAVLATGGWARRAVGAVIALCGLGVLAGVRHGTGAGARAAAMEASLNGAAAVGEDAGLAAFTVGWAWPSVAAVGGLILLASGMAAAWRGHRWPGMSARYDRPGTGSGGAGNGPAGGPASERALWDAIDGGADPTADPAAGPGRSASGGEEPAGPRGPWSPGARGRGGAGARRA
nr:hypothetical protein GCM10020093_115930 [Planobispora longispora]